MTCNLPRVSRQAQAVSGLSHRVPVQSVERRWWLQRQGSAKAWAAVAMALQGRRIVERPKIAGAKWASISASGSLMAAPRSAR